MVAVKKILCFLLSSASICSGLLQEAMRKNFGLVTFPNPRTIRGRSPSEVRRPVSGKMAPICLLNPSSPCFLAGTVGEGRLIAGMDGEQLWSQLLGVQNAGYELWLQRQKSRGVIPSQQGKKQENEQSGS